ncbi:hypothetical protein [Mesorhizobium caraganae]|uniref:hypothetical protein n=1 Tax=Mesorhizobium caraganae TaxID=483206 RepID=UPI003F4F73B2
MLDLVRPIYRNTATYGHFGREEPEFTWEKTDRADDLLREAGPAAASAPLDQAHAATLFNSLGPRPPRHALRHHADGCVIDMGGYRKGEKKCVTTSLSSEEPSSALRSPTICARKGFPARSR